MAMSRSGLVLALVAAAAGCKDYTSVTVGMGRFRIVNSVFLGDSAQVAVPQAVDVLVDSSTSGAGESGLGALELSAGASSGEGAGGHSGAAALFSAAGYRDLPSGVHSFVARASGASGAGTSFFRGADGTTEYLPKQFLMPYPYTLILAGTVRADGTAPDPVSRLQWAMIADDPFTPPADPAGGLTARVQVINAAPMADPSRALSDTTPDGKRIPGGGGADITATFDGAGGTFPATTSYRASSGFMNPPAGSYTLTLTVNDTLVIYSGAVTLAKGEVRTFIVQSTAYAATPGPGNTKVTNLLDNQW
jgi:hypothetical protein